METRDRWECSVSLDRCLSLPGTPPPYTPNVAAELGSVWSSLLMLCYIVYATSSRHITFLAVDSVTNYISYHIQCIHHNADETTGSDRGVQPVAHGQHAAQDACDCGQHKIINLFKTLWDFFFMIMCHNVFNVWPKTTLLLPVWLRDAKRLDNAVRMLFSCLFWFLVTRAIPWLGAAWLWSLPPSSHGLLPCILDTFFFLLYGHQTLTPTWDMGSLILNTG